MFMAVGEIIAAMNKSYPCWVCMLLAIPTALCAQSIFKVVSTPNGSQGTKLNDSMPHPLPRPPMFGPLDITIHFDGTKWTAFDAPGFDGDGTSWLDGVVDLSPTEAWAIGITGIYSAHIGQPSNTGPGASIQGLHFPPPMGTRAKSDGRGFSEQYLGSGNRPHQWLLQPDAVRALGWIFVDREHWSHLRLCFWHFCQRR